MMKPETIARYLIAGKCPFCKESKRTYSVVAGHISRVHNINRREVRRIAGLNLGAKICSPDHSEKRSEIQKQASNMKQFEKTMGNLLSQRSAIAKRRDSISEKEQTERIHNANRDWMGRATPEMIKQRSINATSKISIEMHKKAGMAASPIIKKLHKNKRWKEKWRSKLIASLQKHAKVPRTDYQRIKGRVAKGETQIGIAIEYGVTARFIRRIVTGK